MVMLTAFIILTVLLFCEMDMFIVLLISIILMTLLGGGDGNVNCVDHDNYIDGITRV